MNEKLVELIVNVINKVMGMVDALPDTIDAMTTLATTSNIAQTISASLIPVGTTIAVLFFFIEFTNKVINPDWATLPNVIMFFCKGIMFKLLVSNTPEVLNFFVALSNTVFKNINSSTSSIETNIGLDTIITLLKDIDTKGIKNTFVILGYGIAVLLMVLIILGCIAKIIMTFLGRIVELQILGAVSPIPLSTFASDNNASIGRRFLQNYFAVCLQSSITLIIISLMGELITSITTLSVFNGVEILAYFVGYIAMASLVGQTGSISRQLIGL